MLLTLSVLLTCIFSPLQNAPPPKIFEQIKGVKFLVERVFFRLPSLLVMSKENLTSVQNQEMLRQGKTNVFLPAVAENVRVFQHIGPPTNSTCKW